MQRRQDDSPRIGISACLLGEEVRYDGGHKRDLYIVETLGPLVEWVPVCPEVELGLGTPREAIRLICNPKDPEAINLVSRSGNDLTVKMRRFARRRARELAKENLSGYILKKDSPSCGMERVKIWNEHNQEISERQGRGFFADELLRQFPNLPMEEEGRLHDPQLCENFIERVFSFRKLRAQFAAQWTV